MMGAKMAELRHIVVSGGPFCSFSNKNFLFFGLAFTNIFANIFRECSVSVLWCFVKLNRLRGLDVAAVFL